METVTLASGMELPKIGFGTWTFDNKTVVEPVTQALRAGYRLIDTAAYYGNEVGIGKALEQSGVLRQNMLLATKVWASDRGYKKTLGAFEKSLKRLGTDYLDLYLIHWPAAESRHRDWKQQNAETWRAMEELYQDGRIRAIGVCNFTPKYLQALEETARIMPMVNQIEFHLGFMQPDTVSFCKERAIALQAWSPFGRGEVFENATLLAIAKKYGRAPAQICLKWIMTCGLCPVVKAANPDRMRQNLEPLDFELDSQDMAQLNSIDFFGKLGYDPEKVRF